jgi:hypothetical protein
MAGRSDIGAPLPLARLSAKGGLPPGEAIRGLSSSSTALDPSQRLKPGRVSDAGPARAIGPV